MRIGSGNLVARGSERKPVFLGAWPVACGLILLGALAGPKRARGAPTVIDRFDAGAPPSGPFSAVVGVVVNGQLACSGVLVEARLVLTAASCVSGVDATSSVCLAISGVCTVAPLPRLDPSGEVAAFVLPADALAEPVTYGRGLGAPVAADAVNVEGYEDPASLVATITASDAATYTTVLGSGASYLPTDLGSQLTFTPPSSADGTATTAVYGVLVSLPDAVAGAGATSAVYARIDVLARPFLDPLVQDTRAAPDEGCR